ncbi:MAG: leucine-rich repeat domain-containing protein [Parachlamydiales bacterium]|jgi:Leucine-rich repeat (LRR) protein
MSGISGISKQVDVSLPVHSSLVSTPYTRSFNSEQLNTIKSIFQNVNLECKASKKLELIKLLTHNSQYAKYILKTEPQTSGNQVSSLINDLLLPEILYPIVDRLTEESEKDIFGNIVKLNDDQERQLLCLEEYKDLDQADKKLIKKLGLPTLEGEEAVAILKCLLAKTPRKQIVNAVVVAAINRYKIPLTRLGFDKLEGLNATFGEFSTDLKYFSFVSVRRISTESIKDILRSFPNLESLTLMNCNITSSNGLEGLGQLQKLQEVILNNNSLGEFPHEICTLPNLRVLDLYNNNIESIPSEIRNLRHLESLNLSLNKLTELPAELCHLTTLKTLELASNKLTSLPASFEGLSHLTKLILTTNKFQRIPTEVYGLKNLKCLNLRNNEISNTYYNRAVHVISNVFAFFKLESSLKNEIENLPELEELDLSKNKLTYVPTGIGGLTNLRKLVLENNLLKDVPSEVGKLNKLESLSLLGNKELSLLPPEMGNLASLSELILSQTSLNNFPVEIFKLSNLEILWMEWCGLKELPSEIGKLQALKKLNIGNNQLTSLPKELGELRNLTRLRLMSNKLERLPDEFRQLSKLEKVFLQYNQLKSLPAGLELLDKVKILNLFGNAFEELPKELTALTGLEKLEMSKNKIKTIPIEIGKLSNLRELYLKYNQIDKLPNEIGLLNQLVIFSLYENNLSSLPTEVGDLTKLVSFDLGNNNFELFPEGLCSLKSLKSLYLSNCELKSIPENIRELQTLERLDLSVNLLESLPEGLGLIPSLMTLNVIGNQIEYISEAILRNVKDLNWIYNYRISPSAPYKALKISVNEKNINEKFEEIFLFIGKNITSEHTDLNVIYEDSVGSDMGGLSRNLLTKIFSLFIAKYLEQGWPMSTHPESKKELFTSVGILLAFICRMDGKFPIGQVFNSEFFHKIVRAPQEIVEKTYEDLLPRELGFLLGEDYKKDQKIASFINFAEANSVEEALIEILPLEEKYAILGCDIPGLDPEGKITKNNLQMLQKFFTEELRNDYKFRAMPMYSLLCGFSKLHPVWANRFIIEPMQERVQGKFSNKEVAQNLALAGWGEVANDADRAMANDYLGWVIEWVMEVSDAKVKALLVYATGSEALSYNENGELKKIVIVLKPFEESSGAHTCSNQLELPKMLNKNEVYNELEVMIKIGGFSMS